MQVEYSKNYKEHSWFVDYKIKLNKEDISLFNQGVPYLQIEKIKDLNEGLKNKSFKLKIGAPDDDSNFELHYHPSATRFRKIKSVHATLSPYSYENLKKEKEITDKHDHGLVNIILE